MPRISKSVISRTVSKHFDANGTLVLVDSNTVSHTEAIDNMVLDVLNNGINLGISNVGSFIQQLQDWH
jgi:hypothetical protein